MPGPKLLDKRIVSAEVATQKKRQIDEGIRIAKKVDALRETKQEEEQNLDRFREENIRRVQIEIDAKIRERDELRREVENLHGERLRLIAPLDEEWAKVNEKSAELEQIGIKLAEIDASLLERGKVLEGLEKEKNDALERAKSKEERATKALEKATHTQQEADERYTSLVGQANKVLEEATKREKGVEQREINADMFEFRLKDKERSQQAKEEELTMREVQLQEGWKNLQQTAERLKRGKL